MASPARFGYPQPQPNFTFNPNPLTHVDFKLTNYFQECLPIKQRTQTVLRPIAYEAVHVPLHEPFNPYTSQLQNIRQQSPQHSGFTQSPQSIAPASGLVPNSIHNSYQNPHFSNVRSPNAQQQNMPFYPMKQVHQEMPPQNPTINIMEASHGDSVQESKAKNQSFTEEVDDSFKRKVQDLQRELNGRVSEQMPASSTERNYFTSKPQDISERQYQSNKPRQQSQYDGNESSGGCKVCDEYRKELKEQDDKMRLVKQEADVWKGRCQGMDNERRKAIDELQSQFEESLRTQINSIQMNSSSRVSEVANENQNLQQQMSEAIRDQERLRRKCHELELQQFEWKAQVVDCQSQKDILQRDHDRIFQQMSKLKNELEQLRAANEFQRKRLSSEQDTQRLQNQLEQREHEIDDLKVRNSQLEMLCVEVKKLEGFNQELDSQLGMSQQQNQILQDQLQKKENENEEYKQRLRKLQDELKALKNQDNRGRSQREEELFGEIHHLEQLLNDKDGELLQLQQIIEDLRAQINLLQQRMNQMKDEYEKELSEFQEKNNRYEQEFRDNLDRKFALVKREVEQLQQERQNLLKDLQNIQQHKIATENKNQQLKQESEHQKQIIEQKVLELQNIQTHRDRLSYQLEQQQKLIEELNDEVQNVKMKYANISTDSNRKDQALLSMTLCFIEMDAMRDRLNDKEREVDELKRSSLYKYQ